MSSEKILDSIPVVLRDSYKFKLKSQSNLINDNINPEDSLIIWLIDDAYLDAKILIADNHTAISPGVRYLLKEVIFNKELSVNLGEESYFTSFNLEEVIENQLSKYYDKGFFYARAKIIDISMTDYEVTVNASVIEGPLVLIGELEFMGLNKTSHELLKKYIHLKPGDSLTSNRLKQANSDASEIPFLTFQSPIRITPRAGYTHSDLILNFKEKKRFQFSGGMGYLPESGGKLVWELDVLLRNIFGGGKSVSLKSEHRGEQRDKLNLSYTQPQFLIGTGEFSFKVTTRDYRDEFYEFGIDISLQARLKQSTKVGLGLSWRRVDPSELQINALAYSAYTLTFQAGRSWVDNKRNPQSGGDIAMSLGYVHRRNTTNQNPQFIIDSLGLTDQSNTYNETKSMLSLNFYKPVKGKLVGYLHGEYQGLETSDKLPPLAEMLTLGGPGSIRGYPNEKFIAQRAAMLSVESRIRYESGYLFLFYDGAYMNRPIVEGDVIRTEEIYRDGYGFGVLLHDGLRNLKVSLGWNRESGFNQPRLSVEFSSDL